MEGKSAAEASAVVAQLERPPFIPFRDASQVLATPLTLPGILSGLTLRYEPRVRVMPHVGPQEISA